MFLTWCLESIPIQKTPSESLHPGPRLLQGDVTSPGHQNDGHSERKGFTSHLVNFWMQRWIFRRFLSPEILEQKKEREREERRLYDCMIAMWWFTDFWRYLDQETNPRLPKLFKKLGFFRVCQHQRLGLVPGLWTVCIHLYPHIKSVHSTLAREFVL